MTEQDNNITNSTTASLTGARHSSAAAAQTAVPSPQPTRPFILGAQKYDGLRELAKSQSRSQPEHTPVLQTHREEIFTATFIASKEKGGLMNDDSEQQLLIELVFKPTEKGLKLRPAETQLLLAYMSEILKEIEEEEKRMVDEQKPHDGNTL